MPKPPVCAIPFFDDDGTDAFWKNKTIDDLARAEKCLKPRAQWGKVAPPYDVRTSSYVYKGPELYTTNHETVPQLIEKGDVELLSALIFCGHLPQGLDCPDPEFGLTPAYLAVSRGVVRCLRELP